MIVFKHADHRYPFLWSNKNQPEARWHKLGDGPVHYFSDTPDGAWAEFLRHEEIKDKKDLLGIKRTIWAVEIKDKKFIKPKLPKKIMTGSKKTYLQCQEEAKRLRENNAIQIIAPSAALLPNAARGWIVKNSRQQPAPLPTKKGNTIILFGKRLDIIGWVAACNGQPDPELLKSIRHFK